MSTLKIVPGLGWSGWLPDPGPQFTGPPQPIARWDFVPWQRLQSGVVPVGVVAHHIDGIAHVAISANGGPMTYITEPSVNPATGIYEYWAELDLSGQQGTVELRAIVTSKSGGARVLQGSPFTSVSDRFIDHGMPIHVLDAEPFRVYVDALAGDDADSGLSWARCVKTLARALEVIASYTNFVGAEIVCAAGVYQWGPVSTVPSQLEIDPWISIIGSKNSIIRGSGAGGLRVPKIRLVNFEIDNTILRMTSAAHFSALWMDNCGFIGAPDNANTVGNPFGAFDRLYVTNFRAGSTQNMVPGAVLVRGARGVGVGADAFMDCACVLGVTIDDMEAIPKLDDQGNVIGRLSHPDFWGARTIKHGVPRNMILQHARATRANCQQFYFAGFVNYVDGIAMYDVLVAEEFGNVAATQSQIIVPVRHMVLQDVTQPNQSLNFRHGKAPTDLVVRDCIFTKINAKDPTGLNAAQWENVRVEDGSNYTPPGVVPALVNWRDPAGDDWVPAGTTPDPTPVPVPDPVPSEPQEPPADDPEPDDEPDDGVPVGPGPWDEPDEDDPDGEEPEPDDEIDPTIPESWIVVREFPARRGGVTMQPLQGKYNSEFQARSAAFALSAMRESLKVVVNSARSGSVPTVLFGEIEISILDEFSVYPENAIANPLG